jgi:archaellum component FlaG (FlaF/FlaG flagellin family)
LVAVFLAGVLVAVFLAGVLVAVFLAGVLTFDTTNIFRKIINPHLK